ncbi:hypothetical protein F0L74_09780 [Chitinophaga agrisoli]|uniref:ATP-dependent Clp protease proteolytic subunit n=1 Tax=Chitinophaga agrisoli TaxID=2607653 RepID=A0A5B2VW32_9BACT|nr:ATP-dependent Clp protease proteolytic subunit [Chitinophaga agrisoli]KAA2242808.1 hypothetical protein F0L74_09780 [Chitinophaga agrisoli]
MSFVYTIDPSADEPIMLINRHIGVDDVDGIGIIGDLFQQELLTLDTMGKDRIQVWINSPGGSVVDGYAIYNAILKSRTKVDTYCVGIAASMAAVIFQAGRKRIMADYGILMYHNPFGGDNSDLINKMKLSIVTMICSRSGMSETQCDAMMNRTTFVDSSEAFALKLCDEVELSGDYNKKRLQPVANNSKVYWSEANKILNKQFEKTPAMSTNMLKTTMALGLVEGVPEDAIVNAIKGVQDKADKAEAQVIGLEKQVKDAANLHQKALDEKTAEIDQVKASLTAKQKEFDEMKAERDQLKAAKDTAEKEAKEIAAKNLIQGFVKVGKIKDDAEIIAKWVVKATENFDDTKATLEELPLNKAAVVIPTENKLDANELPTNALSLMAKIKAKTAKQ